MPKRLHIFKSGKHTPMTGAAIEFSDNIVSKIAANYDPSLSQAPIVVGHPKTDDPALGWVTGLSFADGDLFADLEQVEPKFAEAVQQGRFKKISASFYPPNGANNPTPGEYYLRHVGFLGAANPAVKGLKAVQFADDDEVVTVEFAASEDGIEFAMSHRWAFRSMARILRGLREKIVAEDGQEAADRVVPNYEIDSLLEAAVETDGNRPSFSDPETKPQEDRMTTPDPDLAKRQAELDAREKTHADAVAAFAARTARSEAENFIAPLVAEGKVLPGEKDALVAFMAKVAGDVEPVEFAEGETKPPVDILKDFLSGLPKRVEFGETTANGGQAVAADDPNTIAAAASKLVKERKEAGFPLAFAEAVQIVTTNP